MYLNKYSFIIVLSILVTINTDVYSQSKESKTPSIEKIAKKGLVLKLNEKGTSYMKFGVGVEFWYRNLEMNNGTIDKRTKSPINYYSDFALRRMRLSAMVNYENRHYIYTQIGLTSHANYGELHSGIFFHDLWYKTRIANKTFIGAGLHMWNGLSRLSNVTYTTQLTLDNPGVNFPNVNVSDDFVREYGVFLQGQLGRVDYSFSINQPIMSTLSTKILDDKQIIDKGEYGIAFNRYHSNFSYKGYASYSFFEKESVAVTPFKKMTYFGKKGTFLNIGAGFQYTPDASGVLEHNKEYDAKPTITLYDQVSLSADLWFEKPLANESVLNIYSAYYRYDYGSNYLKSGAVMGGFATSDPDAETSAQGGGINQFSIGTGNVGYFSISYVVPQNIFKGKRKLMPFYAVTYKDFEGLNEASFQQDFGIHYLIMGNNVKISAQYSTRPDYNPTSLKISDYKGAFILQLHAKF